MLYVSEQIYTVFAPVEFCQFIISVCFEIAKKSPKISIGNVKYELKNRVFDRTFDRTCFTAPI